MAEVGVDIARRLHFHVLHHLVHGGPVLGHVGRFRGLLMGLLGFSGRDCRWYLLRRDVSGISQDQQCKRAVDECLLHRVLMIVAIPGAAFGLVRALTSDGLLTMVVAAKHAHDILLIHSMPREIGANGEIGNALTAQDLHRPDQTFGNALAKPATLDPLNAIAPPSGRSPNLRIRSAQVQTKHRNLRQAISSQSAHSIFVYARPMRAVSMLCSLRPLLASSIITKPDLLPVGFAGLRHSAGGFLPPAFFLSRVCTLPILRRRDCTLWIMDGA